MLRGALPSTGPASAPGGRVGGSAPFTQLNAEGLAKGGRAPSAGLQADRGSPQRHRCEPPRGPTTARAATRRTWVAT